MIVVWKVLGVLLAAAVGGGFLVARALGDAGPPPDPGPPVVLTDPVTTAPAPTLNPDEGGKGDGKPGSKAGQHNDPPRDDDEDDDDLYPEVEDHDDDGDRDDDGDDD